MDNDPTHSNILDQLRFDLAKPVDFRRVDSVSTTEKVRLLSAAAMYFNILTVTEYGGRHGPLRQEGLVEQVVAAAFQTYQGHDPHPSPFDKAAVLWRGITQGHPFTDGNKRTGFLLANYFLLRLGYEPRPTLFQADVIDLSYRISAGEVRDLGIMAAALEGWMERAGPARSG